MLGIDFIISWGEVWFLIAIGIIWLIGAIIQDFRKLEVANWWSFSLLVIGLTYRGFLGVYTGDYWWFLWGIIGVAGGFILSNVLYYARAFAGGDSKLLMAFGSILLLSLDLRTNLFIVGIFFGIFLFGGGVYGLVYSLYLSLINRKEFSKVFSRISKENKKVIYLVDLISLIFLVLGVILFPLIAWLFALIFLSPWLLVFAKAVEECCMVRFISTNSLTVGDWLVENVKFGKKIIKPNWEGLNEEELKILRGYKGKVKVKYGIPFTPSFLIGFLGLLIILCL